jgi:hypothetical protein
MSRKTLQIQMSVVDLDDSTVNEEKDVIISDDDADGASVHKGKIIHVFKLIKACAMKMYEGVEVYLHHS